MKCSSLACHFASVETNVLLNTLFSDSLNLRLTLRVRDHVSEPCKVNISNLPYFVVGL